MFFDSTNSFFPTLLSFKMSRNNYHNSQFANLNIDGVGIRCHCSSVLVMKDDFEPQPVKNLKATDEGESSEESQHASHPADLVSKRHSSIFCDLQQIFGLQLMSESDIKYLCDYKIHRFIVNRYSEDIFLSALNCLLEKAGTVIICNVIEDMHLRIKHG